MAVNARFMLVLFLNFVSADLRGQGFLEKRPTVHTSSIRSELDGILGQGHGVSQDQLTKINSTLLPIFRALPKNSRGHLSTRIMRYAMRRYFSSSHAWIVKGFEEFGDAINSTNDDTDIVQSKVPGFIRSALEQRFQHQGFALNDMVSMVAAIESLVFNEVVRGIMLSFHFNSFKMGAVLNKQQMSEVLGSYLIIEVLGSRDIEQHAQHKKHVYEYYPNWDNAKMFLADISGSDVFARHTTANPFKEQDYVFEDIFRMVSRITKEYGPWSNYECRSMKDYLGEKDVHGTGRVKLSDFYGASEDESSAWHFTEPSAHLRQSGALDESSSYLGPQVIIANYITSMGNCISSQPYFSVCCLNDCDSIYSHIEDEIGSPNATLSQILPAVETLPSHPNISQNLISKLKDVATVHGGSIPLHGRLFAQWLHFAFPRDCPYPHAPGTTSPKTQEEWREEIGGTPQERRDNLNEEIRGHMESVYTKRDPSPDAGAGMWTFEESLMEFSTPSDAQDATWAWFLRIACHLAVVLAFGSVLVREAYMNLYSAKKGDTKKYSV